MSFAFCLIFALRAFIFFSGCELSRARQLGREYNFGMSHRRSNRSQRSVSVQNVAVIVTSLTPQMILNIKKAAVSLVMALPSDSIISVVLCNSKRLDMVEKTSNVKAQAFIASALLGDHCAIKEAFQKAKKVLADSWKPRRFYIVSSSVLSNEMRTTFLGHLEVIAISFSELHVIDASECILYDYELRKKYFTFHLPRLKVLPISFSFNLPSFWNNIKLNPIVAVEALHSDDMVFPLVAELVYDPQKDFYGFPISSFRNVEFDEEWTKKNVEVESIFPVNQNNLQKLRVYGRFICTTCEKSWKLLRMNDYGMQPDSIEDDLQYTTALYCDDVQAEGIYNTKFVVMHIDSSLVKIFDGTAFRVPKKQNKCGKSKVGPSEVNQFKVYKFKKVITVIFIAVGSFGMRGQVSWYEVNITDSKVPNWYGGTYLAKDPSFTVGCLQIEGHSMDLNNDIFLQIRPYNKFNNTAVWSQWSIVSDASPPPNICGKDKNMKRNETMTGSVPEIGSTFTFMNMKRNETMTGSVPEIGSTFTFINMKRNETMTGSVPEIGSTFMFLTFIWCMVLLTNLNYN